MSRPLRIQIPGGYYHVTCRGNERKAIFRDDTDRQAFLDRLQSSLSIYQHWGQTYLSILLKNPRSRKIRDIKND